MYAVRDEADRGPTIMNEDGDGGTTTMGAPSSTHRRESFLSSMLWSHPQQPANMRQHKRQESSGGGGGGSGGGSGDHGDLRRMRSDSFAGGGGAMEGVDNYYSSSSATCYPPHYQVKRDDLRPSVMEAIQEMMSELEDLHKNINEQALQHIHNGEIILTYALSRTVELVSG
jgi:translation initiation factor eIF-2B subunit beta